MSETTTPVTDPAPTAPEVATAPKPTPAFTAPKTADQRDADAPLGESGMRALQAERAERERLQQEVKPLKQLQQQMEALRKIFGAAEDEPSTDLVARLQSEVEGMKRDTLVQTVARRNGITDDGDIEFLRSATDEAAMNRLAERLKATAAAPPAAPASPAHDPSQGSGPIAPEAVADAEYAAYFPSNK